MNNNIKFISILKCWLNLTLINRSWFSLFSVEKLNLLRMSPRRKRVTAGSGGSSLVVRLLSKPIASIGSCREIHNKQYYTPYTRKQFAGADLDTSLCVSLETFFYLNLQAATTLASQIASLFINLPCLQRAMQLCNTIQSAIMERTKKFSEVSCILQHPRSAPDVETNMSMVLQQNLQIMGPTGGLSFITLLGVQKCLTLISKAGSTMDLSYSYR